MSVFERIREIGILRAVGWPGRRIAALILSEAIGIGCSRSASGLALGYARRRALHSSTARSRRSSSRTSRPASSRGGSRSRSASACSGRSTRRGARSASRRSRRCGASSVGPSSTRPSRSRSVRSATAATDVVVRDEQDRHATPLAQRAEQLDDLRACRGVERAGRLVREQELRLVRERPGDRDPLALAARERGGDGRARWPIAQPEQLVAPRGSRSRGPRPRPIIGTWTFSSAVSVGIRLWNWKTNPTTAARYSDASASRSSRSPATSIVPESGRSSARSGSAACSSRSPTAR